MPKAALAIACLALVAFAAPALAQETPPVPHQQWSFDGPFGTFDRAAAQRGFQVYEEVCSRCHSMNLLHYRDLAGIGYNEEEIKAIAAGKQVTDGPNDQGEMYQRPGRPSDGFVPAFPNEQAARAALNGALPPDLSLIVKAREGGADYVDAILNGFKAEPPPGFKLLEGMYYNEYFPGHQIKMPPPLSADQVTYADGTKATAPQMAHDVATFLTWAAEPNLDARHRMGVKVMLFLIVATGVFYAAKRKIWSRIH